MKSNSIIWVVIMLIALWGGSYLGSIVKNNSWMELPIFLTFTLTFIFGFIKLVIEELSRFWSK